MNRVLQNRYQINQVMNVGGMSKIYMAHDLRLKKSVAIKAVNFQQFDYLDENSFNDLKLTLRSEAFLMAQLRHQAIPRVFDYFVENEVQYMVMELISGITLQKALSYQNGNIDPKQVFDWFFQLIDVIQYLHSFNKPIIHRDIKPANIKLDNKGRIYLLDFGISKTLQNTENSTNHTLHFATLEFAPIEQAIRASKQMESSLLAISPQKTRQILHGKTSPQTDVFSLGATLYYFLTAKLPVSAYNRALSIWLGNADPLLPVSYLNPNIPSELDDAIAQSMSILPTNRTKSVIEFKESLLNAIKSSNFLLPQTEERQAHASRSSVAPFKNFHFGAYLAEIDFLREKLSRQEQTINELREKKTPNFSTPASSRKHPLFSC